MEPSHTLRNGTLPVATVPSVPYPRECLDTLTADCGTRAEGKGEANAQRAQLYQLYQLLPSHGRRKETRSFFTARPKFSGARNHSCPINLTLIPLTCSSYHCAADVNVPLPCCLNMQSHHHPPQLTDILLCNKVSFPHKRNYLVWMESELYVVS